MKTTVVVRGRPNPLQAAGRDAGRKLIEIKRLREKGHRITLLNEKQFWRLAGGIAMTMSAALGLWLLLRPALAPGAPPAPMPAVYDEDRFFVQPVTSSGQTLTFYTDTGGGLFIYRDSAERFGLTITNGAEQGKEPFYVAALPTFRADATIPLPEWRKGRLPVLPRDPKSHAFSSKIHEDGMLGQEWFGEHVWTFDYPGQAAPAALARRRPERSGGAPRRARVPERREGRARPRLSPGSAPRSTARPSTSSSTRAPPWSCPRRRRRR